MGEPSLLTFAATQTNTRRNVGSFMTGVTFEVARVCVLSSFCVCQGLLQPLLSTEGGFSFASLKQHKEVEMKKLLLCLLLSAFTSIASADTWTDPETGITWQYEETNGRVTLIYEHYYNTFESVIPTTISGELIIPSKVNGFPVGGIGQNAFRGCTNLSSIAIPTSVTAIGDNAFSNCSNLEIVYIEDLLAWSKIAFLDYDSNPLHTGAALYLNGECVTELKIPSNVNKIGAYAFYNCTSIQRVTFVGGVTIIGKSAFEGCDNLQTVELSEGLTEIGNFAFDNCTSLMSLTIPESVNWVGCAICRNLQEVVFRGKEPKLDVNSTYGLPSFPNVKMVKYFKYPGVWQDRQIEYYYSSVSIKPLNPRIPWVYIGRKIKGMSLFGGGIVNTSVESCSAGDAVTVTATPKEGYVFLGWSSDVEGIGGSEETLTFTMPEVDEVILIANFFPKALLTTWVNEAMEATLEEKINAKIDGETLLTAAQSSAKTTETINQKVSNKELITSEQLQTMALSEPVIEVKNGAVSVGISLMKASSLDGEWEEVALESDAAAVELDKIQVAVPADEKAVFYKFVVPEKQ